MIVVYVCACGNMCDMEVLALALVSAWDDLDDSAGLSERCI